MAKRKKQGSQSARPFYMVSVPYTGTRFLRKILDENECPPVEQIHTYVQAKWHHWFEGPVVCPIRDPMLHAIGIMHRKDSIGYPRFAEFDLLAILANEQTHFFRVDTTDPTREVAELSEFVGKPLLVDWEPVGQSEDVNGWRARYMETGELPDPSWPSQVGSGTQRLLGRLGYDLAWMEA